MSYYDVINNERVLVSESDKVLVSTTIRTLGDYVFFNDINLDTIVIPNKVTAIGRAILGGTSSLSSVTIPFIGDLKYGACGTTRHDEYSNLAYLFGDSSIETEVPSDTSTETMKLVTQYYAGNPEDSATRLRYLVLFQGC